MNKSVSPNQTPILELIILFGAFSILLGVLLVNNPTPNNQITIQNIDQVHEVFQIDTKQIEEPITQLVLNKGNTSLIGTTTYTNYVWNLLNSTEQITSVRDTGGGVFDLAFRDNQPIAKFVNWDGTLIQIMDMSTLQVLDQFQMSDLRGYGLGEQISHDGHWLVVGMDLKTITIFDLDTGKTLSSFRTTPNDSFSGKNVLSHNKKFLAALVITQNCDDCRKIIIWDTTTGQMTQQIDLEKDISPFMLFINDDNSLLLTAGVRIHSIGNTQELENHLQLFRLDSQAKLVEWSDGPNFSRNMLISPDNHYLAANDGGVVWLWDITQLPAVPKEILHLNNPDLNTMGYSTIAANSNWTLFAVSDKDDNILIYDTHTGKQIRTLSGHTTAVAKILFSGDGRFIISSGYDGTIRFWALENLNFKPFTKIDSPALPTITPSPTPIFP